MSRRSTPRGLKIAGPIFQDTVAAPGVPAGRPQGHASTGFSSASRRSTRRMPRPALLPHLADDGCVVSAQNGLNELVIAEIVGGERTIGCFVNFGADYLEPGVVHYSGHGAVVVGELDGSDDAADRGSCTALMQDFEPKAVLTDNIWGYLWGKLIYGALLFATALTDDSIADVLADRRYPPGAGRAGRRKWARGAQANGVKPEAFNGFDPNAFARASPAARPTAPSTTWSRTTGARPSRIPASGAISRSASARPRSMRRSCRSSRSRTSMGSRCR